MTSPSRVNRGPRAAADNRAALIAAARKVFTEAGFEAPLSLIARTAGVGQGVLYRHFPTRESLALAVFDENIAAVEALAADQETTVEDVLGLIVEQLTASAAFVAMIRPAGTGDPRLLETAWRLSNLLAAKLADPRQRGDLRDGLTATDMVLAVGMLAGLLAATEPPLRRGTAEQAWTILLRGLRK